MNNPFDILTTGPGNVECNEGNRCLNSPHFTIRPSCNQCKLSPAGISSLMTLRSYWKPIEQKFRHPVLEEEKKNARKAKAIAKVQKEKSKDPARKARAKAAARAEKETNRAIIKATRNSGRVSKDGDHLYQSSITLDTKLQSKRIEPVVHWDELEKVRADAKRNGFIAGGLVIRTSTNKGIVVFAEEDLPRITKSN